MDGWAAFPNTSVFGEVKEAVVGKLLLLRLLFVAKKKSGSASFFILSCWVVEMLSLEDLCVVAARLRDKNRRERDGVVVVVVMVRGSLFLFVFSSRLYRKTAQNIEASQVSRWEEWVEGRMREREREESAVVVF